MLTNLSSDFEIAAAGFCEILSRDLPFKFTGWIKELPDFYRLYAYWEIDHGRPPHGLCGASLEIGLVKPEGREQGYESGIAEIRIAPAFQKTGIGKILVRNALDIFKQNGDSHLIVNTQDDGAYFWQNLGFTGIQKERDLNDESSIFDEWSEKNVFNSYSQHLDEIRSKLSCYLERGVITADQFSLASSFLNNDDPQGIQSFLDIEDEIELVLWAGHDPIKGRLPHIVMQDMQVALELKLSSNSQMMRFSEKTEKVAIDEKDFGYKVGKFIAQQRFVYEQNRIADQIYAR